MLKVERKYFSTGDNRKGVQITDGEIQTLLLLYNQRILTHPQMYEYLKQIEPATKSETYRRRVSQKFTKYGIVIAEPYSLGQKGFYFNYYRIGPKGLDILIQEGLISKQVSRNLPSRIANIKNLDHYLSIQQVVISTLSKGLSQGENFTSVAPYDFIGTDQMFENERIVSDWVISHDDQHVLVELDMGTEALNRLEDKVKRYRATSLDNPDRHYSVLFVEIDSSMNLRYGSPNRERRIGNIKKRLLYSKGLELENLDVYVITLERAAALATDLLVGKRPYTSQFIEQDTQLLMKNLSMNSKFGFTLHPILDEFVYIQSENYPTKADMVCELINDAGYKVETVMLVFLEEGNLKSLARVDTLNEYVKKGLTQITIQRIIAFYENREELENDIIGIDYKNVYFGDGSSYGYTGEEPAFYKLVTPYRMEGRALLDWKY
ncbi:replication-relaxation family protein [Priestia koreensis]|uniref:Replication-relaxation n=1 Tax=Priestia koreensis TaxID=284581 RepID=A0A0M0LBB7_9BACI|nr:replication-relaxation family protein [Priestia koreensis]KOO48147.1 hypothetical protein AMD01_04895 [Priestia koreensis]